MQKSNGHHPTPLHRLLRLLHLHRKTINLLLVYAVFIGILNLSLPLGIQAILGLIAGGSPSWSWAVLAAAVILGYVFIGLLRFLQISAMENSERRLMADSALEFAVRIPHLQLEKLRREHLPELINRFFDTLTIQKGMPKILVDGVTAALLMLISLFVLSIYHYIFATFSVLLIILLSLVLWISFKPGLSSSLFESKYKYKIAFWLEEVGRVASTFKLSGKHETPVQKTDYLLTHYLDARQRHFRVLMFLYFAGLVLRVLVIGGFLIAGSILVMENTLNLGQFVAAEILVLFVADALEKVILIMATVFDVLTATEKIGQFTDLPIENQKGISFDDLCQEKSISVEWRNLSFQFDDADQPTLKNLNLQIAAGEKVALVGYPSSGRSTLMQINAGLIQNFSGSLLFNEMPVQGIEINSLRKNIGDVSSQEDIFKGTMVENIAIGRDVSMSEIMEICNHVGLLEYIQTLPEGLNTEILPSGRGLPGSVITKILLARALVGNPSFLVLEDPLDNLNYRDRQRIAALLTRKQSNWTMLVSTSDPTLAAACDKIVVLKDGEIVEIGDFHTISSCQHSEWVFKNLPE